MEAAKKELKEEAGIIASKWMELGITEMDTSVVKCPIYLYLVKDLEFTATEPEETEDIKIIKKSFQEAIDQVMQNKIVHSPSCVLLLKAQNYLKR